MVRNLSPIVEHQGRVREGKGFSKAELVAVELTLGRAKSLGLPVDQKRGSSHDENIEALKEFIEGAKDLDIKVSRPKKKTGKAHVGRAYRGRTSAGQRVSPSPRVPARSRVTKGSRVAARTNLFLTYFLLSFIHEDCGHCRPDCIRW